MEQRAKPTAGGRGAELDLPGNCASIPLIDLRGLALDFFEPRCVIDSSKILLCEIKETTRLWVEAPAEDILIYVGFWNNKGRSPQ